MSNFGDGRGEYGLRAAVLGLLLLIVGMSASEAAGDRRRPRCWRARERIEYLYDLGRPVDIPREVLEELLFGEGPGRRWGWGRDREDGCEDDGEEGETEPEDGEDDGEEEGKTNPEDGGEEEGKTNPEDGGEEEGKTNPFTDSAIDGKAKPI